MAANIHVHGSEILNQVHVMLSFQPLIEYLSKILNGIVKLKFFLGIILATLVHKNIMSLLNEYLMN